MIVAIVLLLTNGIQLEDGAAEGYWMRNSVVVGRILKSEMTREPNATIVIDPLFTLSGPIDPSDSGAIVAHTVVGELTGRIAALPRAGNYAILLLRKDWRSGQYEVPNAAISFMPSSCAIVPINGPGDALVAKVLKTLRGLHSQNEP
jgi:hypothetical protein